MRFIHSESIKFDIYPFLPSTIGVLLDDLFKVLTSYFNVYLGCCRLNCGITHDDHDVCVAREHVNERRKLGIPHLHALELCLRFAARQFELLDDVADFFKPVYIFVFAVGGMRDNKESSSFKQNNFICLANLAKFVKMSFKYFHVRDQ